MYLIMCGSGNRVLYVGAIYHAHEKEIDWLLSGMNLISFFSPAEPYTLIKHR